MNVKKSTTEVPTPKEPEASSELPDLTSAAIHNSRLFPDSTELERRLRDLIVEAAIHQGKILSLSVRPEDGSWNIHDDCLETLGCGASPLDAIAEAESMIFPDGIPKVLKPLDGVS